MRAYREQHFWSIALDSEAARLSMADSQGREYFTIVSRGTDYREVKERALDAIEAAISKGDEPGEVRI